MSLKDLQDLNIHHDNLNIRCNNLTVDGIFNHQGQSGTHITSWTNAFTSPISGDIQYVINTNIITLFIPPIIGSLVNTNQYMLTTVNLPLQLRPTVTRYDLIGTFVDSPSGIIPSVGAFEIDTNGAIKIYYNSIANINSEFKGSNVNYGGRPCGTNGGAITYIL